MSFQIAMVQFAPVRKNISANIRSIQNLLHGVRADLIVLPELANSGYLYNGKNALRGIAEESDGKGPFLSAIQYLATASNAVIVTGYAERAGQDLFNSAAAVSPEEVLVNYRKTHLYNTESDLFSKGDTGFVTFSWRDVEIGIMICFDWIFPESARTLSLAGAQIIVHPANLVLPYCQDAMITRSIENRVFTITANRTGHEKLRGARLTFTGKSQMTSPKGEILFRGPKQKSTVHITEIDPKDALDKLVSEKNNIFADRRPELYDL